MQFHPVEARLGYGGGYSYNRGYRYNYNRYRTSPFAYWLTPYYYPGLFYDSGSLYDYYDQYPYEVGDVAQTPEAQQEDLAENLPPQYGPAAPYYYPQNRMLRRHKAPMLPRRPTITMRRITPTR